MTSPGSMALRVGSMQSKTTNTLSIRFWGTSSATVRCCARLSRTLQNLTKSALNVQSGWATPSLTSTSSGTAGIGGVVISAPGELTELKGLHVSRTRCLPLSLSSLTLIASLCMTTLSHPQLETNMRLYLKQIVVAKEEEVPNPSNRLLR